MKHPLLSVIIPCYNSEKYIEKCLDSIISQTYNNLEIIVINDGSVDNSAEVCENIAHKDNRISIIYQQNQGVSLTRQNGIKIAKGEYITFVDSDDWIHPRMYEIMMNGILKEKADIAQCGVCNVYCLPNQKIEFKHRKYNLITDSYKKYNKIEGVLKILDDTEWQSYMPNKIYKKTLFSNIIFPTNRILDEDLSIMHQIFHEANYSIYFKSEFYFYRQGSLTQIFNDKNKAKKIIDRCTARWERYLFTKKHKEYISELNKMHNIFISVSLSGIRWAIRHPQYFIQEDIENLKQRIVKNPLTLHQQMKEYFSPMKQIEYFIFKKVPWLYLILIKYIIKQ